MVDRLAITELLNHYAHCIDTGRPGLLATEVFSAEVELVLGRGTPRGASAAGEEIC